jgi:hypothetical protein
MFQNGVNASFEQWGLSAPAASYFDKAGIKFTGATGTGANQQQIATQGYIAYYPNGTQGWSEWRRTGFPVLTPAPDAVNTSKEIPRRLVYGDDEYGNTPDAVAAAVARLTGGDTQDAHIWWDK